MCRESLHQIESFPSSIYDKTKSLWESYVLSDNPSSITPHDAVSEYWKLTAPYRLSSWENSLDFSNTTLNDHLNEPLSEKNELNNLIQPTGSLNNDRSNYEKIDASYPFLMDQKEIADYLSDLETSSYLGDIPEILPGNQGSNFVTRPTDCGFVERSSTASFSSIYSNEETQQNLDEFFPNWSFDNISDCAFV